MSWAVICLCVCAAGTLTSLAVSAYSLTLSTDTMLFSTSVQDLTIQLKIPVTCNIQRNEVYFDSFSFLHWKCICWFSKAMHLYSTVSSLTCNCHMQHATGVKSHNTVRCMKLAVFVSLVLAQVQNYCVRMCGCGQSLLPVGSVTQPNQLCLGSGCLFPSQREWQQLRPHHYQQTPDWLPATCGCDIDLAVGRQEPKCVLFT